MGTGAGGAGPPAVHGVLVLRVLASRVRVPVPVSVLRTQVPLVLVSRMLVVLVVLVVRTKPVRRPAGAAARPGSGTSRTC